MNLQDALDIVERQHAEARAFQKKSDQSMLEINKQIIAKQLNGQTLDSLEAQHVNNFPALYREPLSQLGQLI